MTENYELMICIKCHKELEFVSDTYNSVVFNTDPEKTIVTFAIDGGNRVFFDKMRDRFGEHLVYESPNRNGWGPGLYNLITESISYFQDKFNFKHFQSIDYDTLFIGKNADTETISVIDSDDIGMLGALYPGNRYYNSRRPEEFSLIKELGEVTQEMKDGKYVTGCSMVFTEKWLKTMRERGLLSGKWSEVKKHTRINDDLLASLLCRMCGFRLADIGRFSRFLWRTNEKPMGLEKRGVLMYHPVKRIDGDREGELEIRNYYRKIRGEKLLV